jgi:hypothetical protein
MLLCLTVALILSVDLKAIILKLLRQQIQQPYRMKRLEMKEKGRKDRSYLSRLITEGSVYEF